MILRHPAAQRLSSSQQLLTRLPLGRSSITKVMATTQAAAGTDELQAAFAQHQRQAARLPAAERARTLCASAKIGIISTLASKGEEQGYPRAGVIEYVLDESGCPVFSLSSLSGHTHDLLKCARSSLTVMQPHFQDLSEARLTITGSTCTVPEADCASLKETFRQRHPHSFWIDFGDFSMFRMSPMIVRYNYGFASAGKVSAGEFAAAGPDPVAHMSGPIAAHMNDDHAEAMLAITRHFVPLDTHITGAQLIDIDRLGMNVSCSSAEGQFTCRVPFVRSSETRGAVKDVIVEMSMTARNANQQQTQA